MKTFTCECGYIWLVDLRLGRVHGPIFENHDWPPNLGHTLSFEQWDNDYPDCFGNFERKMNA